MTGTTHFFFRIQHQTIVDEWVTPLEPNSYTESIIVGRGDPVLRMHFWKKPASENTAIKGSVEKLSPPLQIYHPEQEKPVATIALNGYNISKQSTLSQRGAMQSFKVIRGNLHEHWECQSTLLLTGLRGEKAPIKIAALPMEAEAFGLIEFI